MKHIVYDGKERDGMKDVELKLVSELMRNSRRSERELARSIGVSQLTVNRLLTKLEKEEVIKEYTIIPDFSKIGYHLLALTFVKLKNTLTPEETANAKEIVEKKIVQSPFGIVMLERGLGLGYDGVIISFYEDYATYADHKNTLKQFPYLKFFDIETFLISLDDEIRYRPLSLTHLADQLRLRNNGGSKSRRTGKQSKRLQTPATPQM